jgi:hypothetical protein
MLRKHLLGHRLSRPQRRARSRGPSHRQRQHNLIHAFAPLLSLFQIASYGRITATSTQPPSHQPWQLAASPGSARPSVSQQAGPEPLRTHGFGTSLRFVNDQGLNHFADACQQNHQHRVRHVPPSRNKQGLNHFAHAGSACPSASSTTRARTTSHTPANEILNQLS